MSGPEPSPKAPKRLLPRLVIWIVVGGIGLYLLIAGIVGILAKG